MCNDENLAPRAVLAEPPEPFRELFAGGRQDEPPEERAARLAAAGDVLAELLEQGGADSVALEDAQYALWLSRSPLVQRGHDICAPSDWWGRVA